MHETSNAGAWKLPRIVWLLLGLSCITELTDVVNLLSPIAQTGALHVPWAVVPTVIALGMLLVARRGELIPHSSAMVAAWAGVAILLPATFLLYLRQHDTGEAIAVLSAAAVEESVFRLFLPAIIMIGLKRMGCRASLALASGLLFSAALFSILPGHVAQIQGAQTFFVFVAFAAVMSNAVWRGRALVMAAAAHATINFLTLSMLDGSIPASVRASGVAAALILVSIPAVAGNEKLHGSSRSRVSASLAG